MYIFIVNGSTKFLFLFISSKVWNCRKEETQNMYYDRKIQRKPTSRTSLCKIFPVNVVRMAIIQYFNYPGTSLLKSLLATVIKEQILCKVRGKLRKPYCCYMQSYEIGGCVFESAICYLRNMKSYFEYKIIYMMYVQKVFRNYIIYHAYYKYEIFSILSCT